MASHEGAGRAKSLGYTNVYVMTEGSVGWVKAGKPTNKI
jgi:rhodanese-related sulfurtransferase